MGFLERVGGADAIQRLDRLVAPLLAQIDRDRYRVLTPEPGRAPILSLQPASMAGIPDRLAAANIVISIGSRQCDRRGLRQWQRTQPCTPCRACRTRVRMRRRRPLRA
ncbi:MAG TPA: hypothetical protein VGA37_12955 [Gemmatimonadales bacterium]